MRGHSETGLDYADQRYHNPGTGRFTTPDPAGDGSNWYSYVGGDPINTVDPTGTVTEVYCTVNNGYSDYSTWWSGGDCASHGGTVSHPFEPYLHTIALVRPMEGPIDDCQVDPQAPGCGWCGLLGCGGGGTSGGGQSQAPCWGNFDKIQQTLNNLLDAVSNQFWSDPRLSLDQKYAVSGVFQDAINAELQAMSDYCHAKNGCVAPDPAYYKGGHYNLVVPNGPESELASALGFGTDAYNAFWSDVSGRFDSTTLGSALHGDSGALYRGGPADQYYFHFDTASPWEGFPLGAIFHGLRDVAGGNLPRIFGVHPCLDF